jgi:hypothetical protein
MVTVPLQEAGPANIFLMIGNTCLSCGRPHTRTIAQPLCPACEVNAATERAKATGEAAREALRKLEGRWAALCPILYRQTDRTKLPADAQHALPSIDGWHPKSGRGWTFHGPTGAGKTRLAYLALRRAFDLEARCDILPAPEIRIKLWQSFESANKVLEKAVKPTVLLIDDLGQGAKSEQADEVLLAILERRVASGKPCIVTTQYSPERIIGRFFSHEIGEAIVRRIGNSFATSVGLGQNKS